MINTACRKMETFGPVWPPYWSDQVDLPTQEIARLLECRCGYLYKYPHQIRCKVYNND